jgi:protein-tyrosine phosphatase
MRRKEPSLPTDVIKVDRANGREVAEAAHRGVLALKKGRLVGFATETVYGVAALATCDDGLDRLRELKNRPARPFSLHLGRPRDAHHYVRNLPDAAELLIRRSWPGPVTLVVPAGGQFADVRLRRRQGLYERLCHDGLIGLRCPDEPVAQAMLSGISLPVVAPSANLAGRPSPRSAGEVLEDLDGKIDLLIDSGPTRYGNDSTVVRCDESGWEVLRPGVYDEDSIRRMLTRTCLFVCTGNTCRSPMAAGLARKILAERLGCKIGDLPRHGVKVLSAGIVATDGVRATAQAIQAARAMGADISRHRSRNLTRELIKEADVVFCMADSHVSQASRIDPGEAHKIRMLDAHGDVPDPVGGSLDVYRAAAMRIEKALRIALAKGIL